MSQPVQLFCWHFMSYPYRRPTSTRNTTPRWITVPNKLWDREKSQGLLNGYIDQLAYADTLGFDGMVLNEHHQNIYGLMPSPNIIAVGAHPENQPRQDRRPRQSPAAARQSAARRRGIRHARQHVGRPPDRRLRAGRRAGDLQLQHAGGDPARAVLGGGRPDPAGLDARRAVRLRGQALSAALRQSVAAAAAAAASADLDSRARNRARPCGRSPSAATATSCRRACTAAPSRGSRQEFAKILEEHGSRYDPFRMGILMSAYVSETDEQAREESHEGVWYFLKNCLKGHLRNFKGRSLTVRVRACRTSSWPTTARAGEHQARPGHAGRRRRLGRADQGAVDHRRQPGHRLSADHRSRPRNPGGQSMPSSFRPTPPTWASPTSS